ncbi:hypothetical protein [Glaciecola sp. KUL10]|uniref:hypothetical protein n=1 Tax=Glaciecola sp. (strain KUL10) TaxID=2161813 RepID=UPI001F299C1B|nr:hypothetical protein [Glaciecola sp. KUL10]
MQQNSEKNLDLGPTRQSTMTNIERRLKKRAQDPFFRIVVILNLSAWLSLFIALVLFHFARPEFISGVQKYWGIEGRIYWSKEHVSSLLTMLQICLGLGLASTLMRSRRNRRKTDNFGVNLFILLAISFLSLVTLYTSIVE